MDAYNTPGGAGSAAPESGEGCEPASCAPLRTIESTEPNCAATATERKAKRRAARAGHITLRNVSTSAEAQRERVVAMLRLHEQSTLQLRRAGIMQTATRIHELRKRGYVIKATLRGLYDPDGYRHEHVAVYTLIAEPEGA